MRNVHWITFAPAGRSKSGKTLVWKVIPTDTSPCIGRISWYAPWRKYAFFPEDNTIFEQNCLRYIADFCENQTDLQKGEP